MILNSTPNYYETLLCTLKPTDKTKEVKTILVLAVPGIYTLASTKLVPILFQKVPKKISGYTGLFCLYQLVPASIDFSASRINN